MNLQKFLFEMAAALLLASCVQPKAPETADRALPITGSWVNLAWQDGRNDFTNPLDVPYNQADLWRTKVGEWHRMGLEYLVIMQVANDGRSYYPSDVMEPAYTGEESPVSAILDEAARQGMKVFLSTGWARNQFEDLRDAWVQERQQLIMTELTERYGSHPAFYGWYLPVEDCITPVFPKTAVEAVNKLVARSHELTPGKKTLISPYGMVRADYDNPELAANIRALKVDIIAYQDEVGCVREPFPLRRLKENWKKLKAIHEGSGIEMWANCETFTWTHETNSHFSALIPAAYSRLLSQQIAATDGGVSRIISFMFGGIIEDPDSPYQLGQPEGSARTFRDYMDWKNGQPYWKIQEQALRGTLQGRIAALAATDGRLTDGVVGEQEPDSLAWVAFPAGRSEILLRFAQEQTVENVFLRCLDYAPQGILPPGRICVHTGDGLLLAVRQFTAPSNNRHDAWIDGIEIKCRPARTESLVLTFETDQDVWIDEIYVNI